MVVKIYPHIFNKNEFLQDPSRANVPNCFFQQKIGKHWNKWENWQEMS